MNFTNTKLGGAFRQEQMASAMDKPWAGGDKAIPKAAPIKMTGIIGEGIKRSGVLGSAAKQSATEKFYDHIVAPANEALRNTSPTTTPSTPPPPSSPF